MTSQSETAKTVRFHKTGDASVLKLEALPVQTPVGDEIRIAVEAIGLNRAEVMFREGQYLETPDFPSKLGYEASGVIEAIGPDVSDFTVGDRVSTIPAFSMGQYGGCASGDYYRVWRPVDFTDAFPAFYRVGQGPDHSGLHII